MVDRTVDVVVIGGGIAGVSAACELAETGMSVLLVEQEQQLAHHTTGRSAAIFLESYGPPAVQALTKSSRANYDDAPSRFDTPLLLHPRGALWVAPPDQLDDLEAMLATTPTLERIDVDEVLRLSPVVRPEVVAAAGVERDAAEIDVLGLHQGYVRGLGSAGGTIERWWAVSEIDRAATGFVVRSSSGREVACGAVVNASGAWGDVVGALAGAEPIGLEPKRRTIAICPTKVALDPTGPLVGDVDHGYYWKAEGPNVLCSPADEHPSDPCDARPEELDVALAIERVNETTILDLRSVQASWAGLRTFAADRVPVCGEDADVPGFWWLVGQGGYGIQTAPAMARSLAGLLRHGVLPDDVLGAGVAPGDLSPRRFRGPH
ncbi:MAG: NAD(P)/FAD-dependent oxidoreductase [Acidimicrobiia bacterium]